MLPYALRHLIIKPFRISKPARISTATLDSPEWRRAAHDMYCEMFLDGYREVTMLRPARSTGVLLVLFMILMFSFDQEFERSRRRSEPPDYQTLLDAPRVVAVWQAMTRYVHILDRDEVLAHVLDTFADHYDDYRRYVREAKTAADFETTLRLVELDSGRTIQTVYELIRLFNGHGLHQGCAAEFFAVGMAGKFLDDLRDLADDRAAGDPNILHALAAAHTVEAATLEAALGSGEPLTLGWWSQRCPITLQSFFRHTFHYYDQVTSARLRLPLDICLALLHTRSYWRTPIRRSPLSQP